MSVNNRQPNLVWQASNDTTINSTKIPDGVRNILKEEGGRAPTLNMSRVAGIAIQFILPPEHLREMEWTVNRDLAEYVDVPLYLKGLVDSPGVGEYLESHADGLSVHQLSVEGYDEIGGTNTKLTITGAASNRVSDMCAESDEYNFRQQSRLIANCVYAWEASPCVDVMGRIHTKQQLARAAEGEFIAHPTNAYQGLLDGEWGTAELQDLAEKGRSEDEDEFSLDDIEADSDATLSMQEANRADWTKMPKSSSARVGPFMALARWFVEEKGDGLGRGWFETHFGRLNSDYKSVDSFLESHILPRFTESDGMYYLHEENAEPEESEYEEVQKLAGDINRVLKPSSQGRGLRTALTNNMPAEVADAVVIGGSVSADILTGEVVNGDAVEVSDVESALDYLLDGLSDTAKRSLSDELDTVSLE